MTGSGTQADPYIIENVTDLQNIENDLTAYYELGGNIDASATSGWNGGKGFVSLGGGNSPSWPSADGDILEAGTWTRYPAGGTLASKVTTHDGDTSYIQAKDNACEAVLSFPQAIPSTAQNIRARVEVVSKNVASGTSTMRGIVRIGDTNYYAGKANRTNTVYASTAFSQWITNPATGLAWTPDQINGVGADAIQGAGVGVTDSDPNIRFSFIVLYVWYDDPFLGQLDGKGFVISDLFQNRPDATINGVGRSFIGGLFRENQGVIKNLGLEDLNLTCSDIGGLAEINYNGGLIDTCYTTGLINGDCFSGGLVGEHYASCIIRDSYSTCAVDGATGGYCGGLVGYMEAGEVLRCYATGAVSVATNFGGGLIGYADDGDIDQSYATGAVTIGGDYGGGFIGLMAAGTIDDCYAKGVVIGVDDYHGGFIGWNLGATIDDCYSTGAVSGDSNIGGFCGGNSATITNCFWDTEASGVATSDGGTGKTTALMKTKSAFTDAGWDFITTWNIFGYCNDTYPCLRHVTPSCEAKVKGNPNIDQLIYQHVERVGR